MPGWWDWIWTGLLTAVFVLVALAALRGFWVLSHADRPAKKLELADLYFEARFSGHGSSEQARSQARAALTRLRAQLDAAVG